MCSDKSVDCPFCSLEEDRILRSDDLTITLRDGFPVNPGHTLIVPRRHVASFFQILPDEQLAMLNALSIARESLQEELSPDGFNVGINDGTAAGQTVMHLHIHLIPRFDGDMEDPRGGVRGVIPHKQKYIRKA